MIIVHVKPLVFSQNTTTDLLHRMNETDIFYVSTSLPGAVQVISCIYLTIIFLFSVPANIGIFVLFFKSPVVSKASTFSRSLRGTRTVLFYFLKTISDFVTILSVFIGT